MIIDSFSNIPYFNCTEAEIFPEGSDEFAGTFKTGGETFTVRIETDGEDGSVPRVWARIKLVNHVETSQIDSFACAVASKAREDPDYMPVKVYLRNGMASYMKTWTYDYPDDEAMDAFIKHCKEFIEEHLEELRHMAEADMPVDAESLINYF